MNHNEIEHGVKALLLREGNKSINWVQAPFVTHIPFMGSRDRFFLLISLHLKQVLTDREALLRECLSAASRAIGSHLLVDEKAVEVAVYVEENGKTRRAVRLTILDAAFDQTMRINASDVLKGRIKGVSSQWPLQHRNGSGV